MLIPFDLVAPEKEYDPATHMVQVRRYLGRKATNNGTRMRDNYTPWKTLFRADGLDHALYLASQPEAMQHSQRRIKYRGKVLRRYL